MPISSSSRGSSFILPEEEEWLEGEIVSSKSTKCEYLTDKKKKKEDFEWVFWLVLCCVFIWCELAMITFVCVDTWYCLAT